MQSRSKTTRRVPKEQLDDLVLVLTFCGGLAGMIVVKLCQIA